MKVTDDFVLLRKLSEFGQRLLFRFAGGQVERIRQANIFWDGRVNERIEAFEAHGSEHGTHFLVVRADVTRDKTAEFCRRRAVRRG